MAKDVKRLYRSNKEKIFGGVCGGIAEYLEIDPVIVRVIFVFLLIASFGAALIAYIIAWVIIPEEASLGKNLQEEKQGKKKV